MSMWAGGGLIDGCFFFFLFSFMRKEKVTPSISNQVSTFFSFFFCLKLFVYFIMSIQHLFFFITRISLLSSIIISLTIFNNGLLVYDTHFIIKINTINHFLNNRVKLKHEI